MNKDTNMETKELTTPQAEHLFLKRNALLVVILSLFYVFMAVYELLSSVDNLALRVGFWIVSLFIIVDLIWILIRVSSLASKVKSAFWFGNYEDEFFNHLNHKAYKYSFNMAIIASFLLMMLSDNSFTTPWLDENTALIIFSTLCLSYGVPLLFWLRKGNE